MNARKYNSCFFFFFFSKYFPEHRLPENVIATTDAKAAFLGADYCLHAVPVQVLHFHVSLGYSII
jgi:glycerol-3-phosphate dehydrogenase